MPIQVQLGETKPPLDPAAQRELRRRRRFWTGAALIVTLLAFIVILRLYAFEATVVVSPSMEPTLRKGDYALFDHRAALRGRWNRGDVVLFEPPQSWRENNENQGETAALAGQILVKRIIGMPGEAINVVVDRVYIDGQVLKGESFLKDTPAPQVTLPIVLGPDQYYVMGDNRNNSSDSRENGPIAESNIRGRVVRRLWPPGRMGVLEKPDFGPLNTDR